MAEKKKDSVAGRKLSKADLDKLLPWAQTMVERFSSETKPEEILEMLAEKYEEHSSKPAFSAADKIFLLNRAKSSVNTKLTGIGNLKNIPAILLGPSGRAKNWSEEDVEKIQDDAKKGGRKAVFEMAAKGIIAGIKIKEGDKPETTLPVSKMLAPMQKVDKKWVIRKWLDKEETKPAYELWKDGDPVIPLDTRAKLGDDKTDNGNQGNVLLPNWSVSIICLAWLEGANMPKVADWTMYNEVADPSDKQFVLDKITSKNLWLKPIILKVEVNEKKTKDGKVFLKNGKDNRYAIKEAPTAQDFDLYSFLMNQGIVGMPSYSGDPFDGSPVEMPVVEVEVEENGTKKKVKVQTPIPMADLSSMREFHEKLQMTTNAKGEAKKDYGMVACMEATLISQRDADPGKSISVVIKDNSLTKGRFSGFLPSMYHNLPFGEAADVLMFVTTAKKKDFYDVNLHQRVKDETGKLGELAINIVNMKVLMEHDIEDEDEAQEDAKEEAKEDNKEAEV